MPYHTYSQVKLMVVFCISFHFPVLWTSFYESSAPLWDQTFLPQGRAMCCLSSLCGSVGRRAVTTQLFTANCSGFICPLITGTPFLRCHSGSPAAIPPGLQSYTMVPMENEGCLQRTCMRLIDDVCSIYGPSDLIWDQTCSHHGTLLPHCFLTLMFAFETMRQTLSFLCGVILQT